VRTFAQVHARTHLTLYHGAVCAPKNLSPREIGGVYRLPTHTPGFSSCSGAQVVNDKK
jgi:hypothetical protein